ncbi:MAG: tRNA pseudouridine(38-40) synthase TruA [Bacteroidota bacterium]|nr:tRNA pseudouridine(38-40) synthase TruA [Bacteroidota bacterium]
MTKNVKIIIEYDGTDFVGWQRQPNGRSVQGEIEDALRQIFSEKINVVGSGRTDSGVHARGQAANFFIPSSADVNDLLRSLNGLIFDDIVIHDVQVVEEKFSARYSAKEREYRYFITQMQTALERRYCWHVGYQLDIAKMNDAASKLIGSHDFQTFCRAEAATEHYLSSVFDARWDVESTGKLFFTIRANRFLHGMVRLIVGTLVDVGRGFTSVEEFEKIFHSHDVRNTGQSAPAHGLFLERVVY